MAESVGFKIQIGGTDDLSNVRQLLVDINKELAAAKKLGSGLKIGSGKADGLSGTKAKIVEINEELAKAKKAASGFKIKIDGADELAKVELRLSQIGKELSDARKQQNTPIYDKLRREQLVLQQQAGELRKDIRRQIKDFQDIKNQIPTDSIISLSKRYGELTREINKMSKSQRDSDFGKNVIKEANQIKSEIDKVQQSMGNFRGNVGNYRSALGSGLDGLIGGQTGSLVAGAFAGAATGQLAAQGAMVAATALKNVLVDATNVVLDYDEANANLNAILGKNTEQTGALRQQQQELGGSTAFTAAQVANLQTELAKLGFTQEEIIASGEGITQFAIATQADVGRAAALVGSSLRSFNLDASESQRVVEVLAASANKTSLDFGTLEVGLPIVGGVAAEFGMTIEDVAAQLGVLSDRGIDASTAATALRNIYLKSAKAGITYQQALDKVANAQNPVNEAFALFGVRGALQATILAENSAEVTELTGEITGLDGALKQMADTQLESVRGRLTLLRSAWESLVLSVEDGSGVMSEMSKNTIDGLSNITTVLRRLNDGTIGWGTALKAVLIDVEDASKILDDLAKSEKDLAKRQREGYDSWMTGIGQIFPDLLQDLEENENKTRDYQEQIEDLANNTIDGLQNKIKDLREELGGAQIGSENYNRINAELAATQEKLSTAQGKVNKTMKEAKEVAPIDSIAGMEGAMRELNKQLDVATDKNIIVDLLNQSVELGSRIKAAKVELDGLRDIAEGGALSKQLSLEIDKEVTGEIVKTARDADEEVSKIEANRLAQEISDLEFLKELEKQSDKEVSDELAKLGKKQREEESKAVNKQFEDELKLVQDIQKARQEAYFSSAQSIANATFEILNNASQRQLDEELQALNDQYGKRIESAEGNASLQEKLQEELAAKQETLNREAFEENKKRQIAEALINGALAIVQALANTTIPFPASLLSAIPIAAATGAQVAAIASTSYDQGGFTGFKGIKDMNLPGRKITGYVHDKEYVAPTSQIQKYPQLFKALEMDRTRGFAEGGLTSPLNFDEIQRGLDQSSGIGTNLTSGEFQSLIQMAVYQGAREGALVGSMEGSKAGTYEGSTTGTREGVVEASRETEFTRIRTERANKNLKE